MDYMGGGTVKNGHVGYGGPTFSIMISCIYLYKYLFSIMI